ncbi:EAL domain-containing protein [Filobacillus milosensis]|uniref:EAL domain-containing protein n=1 Tax=Filobacillus milosensis TaxID=94137 RepID=A0A4Y8IEE2_9BACI|nr:EAL domain-containing protein [Filobacillus milosensis]TFB14658.1 EAL domain-containing protein [Filobacillus milosensis]
MAIKGKQLELGLHPFKLSFKDLSLEKEYKADYDNEIREFNRMGIVLSYFAWLAFGIFSYAGNLNHFFHITLVIVFGLYPIFTLNLLILSSQQYLRYFQVLTALSNVAAGLSIIYIGQFILDKNLVTISGVFVVILFAFFILRLRYKIAVLTSLIYVTVYQFTMIGENESGILSLTLWVVEITCIIGGNQLERANRKSFHQNKMRQKAEERSSYLAYHDMLTGLPNRFMFTEKLRKLIKNGSQFAVLFIDLDQFKKINDTRGHTIGDQILQLVAQRLLKSVSKEDIVARLGGDEFTIILPSKTKTEVAHFAEKIVTDIRTPFFVENSKFHLKASVGISLFPVDGENLEALLKNSDIAMYSSKEYGGNNYRFFNNSMNSLLEEKVNLERMLHSALANEEFLVYYQPQIDLRTGQIFGAEALIRWEHPHQGMIPPDQFVPIAEETGLIGPIGDWVLRTACFQAKRWNREHEHPIRIAVNLSVKQLINGDIVSSVSKALHETGLDPNLLELELTESIFMQDAKFMVSTLNELKKLGVRISIDDFGTGYSSLAYLKDYPIDSLKVDRTFVHNLLNNKKNTAIVSAVITLARRLGIRSVAEGIENAEQLNFLEMEGCDLAQGYYFSRPLSEDQMNDLLGHSSVSAFQWVCS